MPRAIFYAFILVLASPALSEAAEQSKPAPLIDPDTLEVNQAAAKQLELEHKQRDMVWDAKVRRAMSGICRGC